MPGRVVLDNLKAAIIKASMDDPLVLRAYRACAEHYGFRIAALPPRTPHLKGKVDQGGVHYVARDFPAGREPEPLDELNAKLKRWLLEVAGRRVHGTTKAVPLERFEQAEAIGPSTLALVGRLLDHRPEDRLKIARRVLRLGATFGPERLERACQRALFYDSPEYPTLKRILAAGLDAALDAATAPAPPVRFAFARQAAELVRGLFGGHHDDRE